AVKQHNLMWAALCLFGVALTMLLAIRSPFLGTVSAVVAIALTYEFFLRDGKILDRTYTEIQASALIVWCSVSLIAALKTGRPMWFVTTGILVGALALTKASFLYIGIGLAVVLILYLGPQSEGWSAVSRRITLLVISMMLLVVPWMARNLLYFDSFEITQRG